MIPRLSFVGAFDYFFTLDITLSFVTWDNSHLGQSSLSVIIMLMDQKFWI